MFSARTITALHRELVLRWHRQPIDNPCQDFAAVVAEQFSYNFRLWHEEDIARSPHEPDSRIAEVKRTIDRLNQQRNDGIERIDDVVTQYLADHRIVPGPEARQNSETVGSIIDRLSILALRIYHLEEQLVRDDVDADHRDRVGGRLEICRVQLDDLACALDELWDDIRSGAKRHKTYRQLKMYNDKSLNPYLYQSRPRAAG